MMPVFMLFLFSTPVAHAQDGQDEVYVDYNELLDQVLAKLKKAQTLKTFLGSSRLRTQTLALPADAKATISSFAKPGKKKLTAPQLVNRRKDGVLMICKYYKAENGQPEKIKLHATATALTEDGICVSNWHVFMNFIQPELQLETADSITFVVTLKGDVYPIERVLAYSEKADAAIFRINTGVDRLTPVPLGAGLAVGETVHTLSNPEGYLYYYSKGVVARNTANHTAGPMGDRMEITADYAKGSSGGPILDDRGNLAGMVSSTHSIYAQDRPQINLQMVIKTTTPVGSIRRLFQFE